MTYRDPSAERPIVVCSLRNQVFGLDANTGAIVWEHQSGVLNQTTRIHIHGAVVYAVFGDSLECLDYASGRVIWQQKIDASVNPILLVLPDRIFVGGSGSLHCFSHDGALVWTQPFKGKGYGNFAIAVPGLTVQADHTG